MKTVAILIIVVSHSCLAQGNYTTKLVERLAEIRKLTLFDNEVVISDDTSRYGFPKWEPSNDYYEGDMVSLKGETFSALVDNKGKIPSASPLEWEFISGTYHPYQYLRDTARVDELRNLLKDDHPYVKAYAFGALAHRKVGGLFEIVMDNLSDESTFLQMTGDSGKEVTLAFLMIRYCLYELTPKQIGTIRTLILKSYPHQQAALILLENR